ncbi:MFS transporter [Streptomyces sp. NRRL F-2664]|uniref:MFS transporter n=1 Tax=Streptomyces sp. NRRL F-2664 TaxID=1463842 RepID=UPI0004C864A7|nr:MFS transporter [Streptomyces sp. NRRL F-2664]
MATTGTARSRAATAPPAPGPPARLRFGYASGSLVTATFTTLPGLLLLPYLTDTLGVGAALAGIIVFLPKAWDALLNPLVGRASDRTRTRWGNRRPYVLWGGLAMAAAFALTFSGPLPGTAGAWFTAAGYLLTATAFAFFQVPYVAMPAELAVRDEDRTRLVGGRVTVIGIAALLTGAAAPALIDAGGGGLAGHRWVGAFGAVVIAVGAVWVFAGTGGAAPAGTGRAVRVRAAGSGPGLRRQFAAARADAAFRALLWCAVVQSAATGVLLAGAPYFADHVLGGSAGVGALVVAFVAPNLLTLPLWSRLRGRRGYALASALFAAGCLLLCAAPVLPTAGVVAVMALTGTGHAGQLLFLYALLARHIARTDHRSAGVLSGLFTTGEGLGLAAGPFVYGLVLQLSGYASSATGRAAEQTATAELGVLAGFAVLPALATAAAVALLRGYGRPPAPTDP